MQPTLPPKRLSRRRRALMFLKKNYKNILIIAAAWLGSGLTVLEFYKLLHPTPAQVQYIAPAKNSH